MNDYCKIGARANPVAKSRSIDFSDLSFSPPQTPKYHPRYSAYKAAGGPQDLPADEPFPEGQEEEEEDGTAGERFGVILSRNCSTASRRFRAPERGHASSATLHAAVRRAFSMRKSSSVSEGYRRIHDTAEDDGDGGGDCDVVGSAMSRVLCQPQQQEAMAPRKKRGKILRACKRIFGF